MCTTFDSWSIVLFVEPSTIGTWIGGRDWTAEALEISLCFSKNSSYTQCWCFGVARDDVYISWSKNWEPRNGIFKMTWYNPAFQKVKSFFWCSPLPTVTNSLTSIETAVFPWFLHGNFDLKVTQPPEGFLKPTSWSFFEGLIEPLFLVRVADGSADPLSVIFPRPSHMYLHGNKSIRMKPRRCGTPIVSEITPLLGKLGMVQPMFTLPATNKVAHNISNGNVWRLQA